MRKKVFVNGFEWWIDTVKYIIYETSTSTEGTSLFSNFLTGSERKQFYNKLRYDR